MTQLRNNFQGLASGTTLTAANSGGASGDAFNSVTAPPTGGTLATAATPLLHAPVVLVVQTTTTTGNPNFAWTTSMGTKSQIWGRFYLNVGTLPAASNRIVNFMSGATQCASIVLSLSGNLIIRTSASVDVTTSTTALATNTWYRIEFRYQFSTTTGNADISIYANPDSTTATETISATSQNFGAASADTYTFGQIASSTTRGPFRFADVALDDTAAIGPTLLPPELVMARYGR